MITRIKQSALAFFALTCYLTLASFAPPEIPGGAMQAPPRSGLSLFNSLNQREVLEVTLKTQLDTLIQTRKTEEYTEAQFSYEDTDGTNVSYEIKVKPRGKFRRRICDFPPLKLKFSKKDLEARQLESFNDLKLVTHCLDDESISKGLILKEYLAYKLYNVLTPNSFRVQLVKINYEDINNKKWKMTRWGILIEDTEELAHRLGAEEIELFGQPSENFNTAQEKIMSLFQYMIGNADWDCQMLRNLKLLKIGEGKFIPVPYDFDFSMLVKAPYLRPNIDVQQTGKMERVFMGFAATPDELYATSSYFRSKKDALLAVVKDFKPLDRQDRLEVVQYLEEFFEVIENAESLNTIRFAQLQQR